MILLDAATGEAAEVKNIHWPTLGASGPGSGSLTTEKPVEGKSHFEFAAPIGSIFVGSFASGYTSLSETLQIDPGRNEFTFKLDRECPLTITFLDGETPVPIGNRWHPHPEHLDGDGELLYTNGITSGFKSGLSQPGRYALYSNLGSKAVSSTLTQRVRRLDCSLAVQHASGASRTQSAAMAAHRYGTVEPWRILPGR